MSRPQRERQRSHLLRKVIASRWRFLMMPVIALIGALVGSPPKPATSPESRRRKAGDSGDQAVWCRTPCGHRTFLRRVTLPHRNDGGTVEDACRKSFALAPFRVASSVVIAVHSTGYCLSDGRLRQAPGDRDSIDRRGVDHLGDCAADAAQLRQQCCASAPSLLGASR